MKDKTKLLDDGDMGSYDGPTWILRKLRRVMSDPRRGVRYIRTHTRKVTHHLSILATPVTHAWRRVLLGYPPDGVEVVRIPSPNLAEMPYEQLRSTLKGLNDTFISWPDVTKPRKKNASTPAVSVIVLVLNNLDMTLRCIDSVMQSDAGASFELIVIDNGSHVRTIRGLRRYKQKYPQITLIHSEQNLNFAIGNNLGFTHARSDIVVFLNNDTYVTDNWLGKLVKPLKNQKVKAVQPALFYPDNTIQCIGIVFSDKSSLGYGMYVNISKRNKTALQSRKFQAVTGACLAMRSTDFVAMKGFDPSFINGQEDVDLCLRLTRGAGGYCYCESGAVVYHDEGKTKGRGKYVVHNRRVFLDRWQNIPRADDEAYYKKDGYRVIRWNAESSDITDQGLGVFTPVIKRIAK